MSVLLACMHIQCVCPSASGTCIGVESVPVFPGTTATGSFKCHVSARTTLKSSGKAVDVLHC